MIDKFWLIDYSIWKDTQFLTRPVPENSLKNRKNQKFEFARSVILTVKLERDLSVSRVYISYTPFLDSWAGLTVKFAKISNIFPKYCLICGRCFCDIVYKNFEYRWFSLTAQSKISINQITYILHTPVSLSFNSFHFYPFSIIFIFFFIQKKYKWLFLCCYISLLIRMYGLLIPPIFFSSY